VDASRLEFTITPEDPEAVLRQLRQRLLRRPREIPARFFYDDAGSRLFERITELPEYYQTRTEERILRESAADIVARTGAEELIELGSGAATKTRVLLDAMRAAGRLRRYVPFDVSEGIMRRVAMELLEEYPELQVHAVVADFTEHLDGIPEGSGQLCIFLGGTIGNFTGPEARRFLGEVAGQMRPGGCLLLGTDLIKDPRRLEAAYNDAEGVTAAFNRNALRVLNRKLDGDFDPEAFEHRAPYNAAEHRIEMWLRSRRRQRVRLPRIDLDFTLEEGEEILTEISVKYDRALAAALLAGAGFRPVAFYTDPEQLFALTLARKETP